MHHLCMFEVAAFQCDTGTSPSIACHKHTAVAKLNKPLHRCELYVCLFRVPSQNKTVFSSRLSRPTLRLKKYAVKFKETHCSVNVIWKLGRGQS